MWSNIQTMSPRSEFCHQHSKILTNLNFKSWNHWHHDVTHKTAIEIIVGDSNVGDLELVTEFRSWWHRCNHNFEILRKWLFLIQGTRTVERRLKNYISSRKRQNGLKGENGVWRAIGAPLGTIGTEQGQMEALWSHVHALSRDFKLSDLIGRLLTSNWNPF